MRVSWGWAVVSVALAIGGAAAAPPPRTYFVDVAVPGPDAIRTLAEAGFDIAGVTRNTMAVGIVATADELVRLEQYGWQVTLRGVSDDQRAIDALSDYHDPQEISATMDQIVATYPNIAKKLTLADTLFEGQKQYALLITKDVAMPNDRPAFILDAQHHAREVMTPEIALDMMDYLTSRYATDADVQRWVDNINIYVVPSVNPDGAMYVFTSNPDWRRNRHTNCPVDNNRNYPTNYGQCNGSEASCNSEVNRGSGPGSEPETQGMIGLTSSVRPFFTLSYHSYGEQIMYPYGCYDNDEMGAFQDLADWMNASLVNDAGVAGQYRTGPLWSTFGMVDGASIDDQYNRFGVYSFTIEVNAHGIQPDYATWRDVTVQRQRAAWQFLLVKTLDGPQIQGTVTDSATGLPLPAQVGLQEVVYTHGESPHITDAGGRFRLLARAGLAYHVTASAYGYCSGVQPVQVYIGPATANLSLLQQPATPRGVTATPAGDNAIDVSWQAVQGAVQYTVYRSNISGGPYTLVATVPSSQLTFHDAPVSGGFTYYYVVRAVQGCESISSMEVSALATGPCLYAPTFAGVASVSNPASTTCGLNLSWNAASTPCGGVPNYSIYRSTTAPFTPSASNRIAAGISGTSYLDHDALSSGTTYNYIVRASDPTNGATEGNVVTASTFPTGPTVQIGDWTDDAGDTSPAKLTLQPPWSIKTTGGHNGPQVYSTGTYGNNLCRSATTPALVIQTGSVLTFATKYDIEPHDVVEVQIAPGPAFSVWNRVPVNYPDIVFYLGNKCGIVQNTPAFSRSITTPTYPASLYAASLDPWVGQNAKLRWLLSTDSSGNATGFWVDDVTITNVAVVSACTPGSAASAQEAGAAGGMTASRGSGTSVAVSFAPACGALDGAIYWGSGPIVGSTVWTNVACGVGNSGYATFDPGDPLPDSFYYFVVVGQRTSSEGSYGTSTLGERPEASGLGACDRPQVLGGACP